MRHQQLLLSSATVSVNSLTMVNRAATSSDIHEILCATYLTTLYLLQCFLNVAWDENMMGGELRSSWRDLLVFVWIKRAVARKSSVLLHIARSGRNLRINVLLQPLKLVLSVACCNKLTDVQGIVRRVGLFRGQRSRKWIRPRLEVGKRNGYSIRGYP